MNNPDEPALEDRGGRDSDKKKGRGRKGMRVATTAGIARASITPLTTSPDPDFSITSANTAMLLNQSPMSLTTWPIQVYR